MKQKKQSRLPPKKGNHGGKREGAGRYYSPHDRMKLAERHAELKYEFTKAGVRDPAAKALDALHAELHPDGGGDPESTRRSVMTGRGETDAFMQLDAELMTEPSS
jgi:hypothetical protein